MRWIVLLDRVNLSESQKPKDTCYLMHLRKDESEGLEEELEELFK